MRADNTSASLCPSSLDDQRHGPPDDLDPERRLRDFLSADEYPCLGAHSVVKRSGLSVVLADSMSDLAAGAAMGRITSALHAAAAIDLARQSDPAAQSDPPAQKSGRAFRSTAVVFQGPVARTEKEFEDAVWSVLERLAAVDTEPWAPQVSSDPADPRFGFSFSGAAFFVVGMHPNASRRSRRTPSPTMVFNGSSQFEALREAGAFQRMRDTIRRRDVRWQGSVNPMMADHGQDSEARQYAGRAVPQGWVPPFHTDHTDLSPAPHQETGGEAHPEGAGGRCPWTRAAS